MNRIGVIGGGAWGTALAMTARRAGGQAVLWAREHEVADAINLRHENPIFLPGVTLDKAIVATTDLTWVAGSDILLLVVPAQHLRASCRGLAAALRPKTPVIICSKGIEEGTGAMMTEVVEAELPEAEVAVLSGPTFAAEVARGQPTAVTLAIRDAEVGARLIEALGTSHFRPYLSDDLAGAEIGGAVKNVLAIACGVVMGRKLGDNARAALITRGLAEMARLALAKGGKPETLMGLSGLGDLTLTCTSIQSRNHSLGVALGEGRQLADILAERRSVAEGVASASATAELAARLGIEMPITAAVDQILHRGGDVDKVVAALLARPFRSEALG